jgi:hypothetical protein
MLALGDRQRVDDAMRLDQGVTAARELRVDEAEIEMRVVCDQARTVDEFEKLRCDRVENRLVGEIGVADAVDGERLRVHFPALRIDVDVEGPARGEPVYEFHAADLDHPVGSRIQPRRFGVKDDFTHRISSGKQDARPSPARQGA